MTQPGSPRRPPRVRAGDVRGALWSLVVTAAGLGVAIALVPGVTVRSVWALVLVAAVVAVGDVLLRPLLRVLARRSGVVGALLSGLGAQLLVAWLALTYLPGVQSESWTDALAVLVVSALVMATGRWLVGSSDDEYVLGALLRRARRRAHREAGGSAASPVGRDRPAGLLVVMLDGVARPTLDHALQAGLAPTLARWLTSGSHHLESWWARVPATTPASTVGLLHGSTEHVPAFRWWSRAQGRLVVTNRPVDAADVEARTSDGRGLLADDGVAVSTMFSGDAATSLLVMSRATSGVGPGQLFVHFFASPFVLVRALLVTAGEWCKELFQGWQQAARGVEPRVSRLGWYPVLRALTNVVLRDLNTTLVAEQLVRGAPVVCVDLVDYDEIAHHAGPLRPESLRALEGLDRVLGLWEQVAAAAPRDYEIVVLSDHGQSLGATFEQVVGRSFLDEVRRLMAVRDPGPTAWGGARRRATAPDNEEWGPTNTALHALRHEDSHDGAGRMYVGPDRSEQDGSPELPEVAVVGSGNLGMIWFCREPARVDGRTVRARWPGLVPGLLANPAVGVVVVHEDQDDEAGDQAVVAYGPSGRRDLTTGEITGRDPLAAHGSRAAADLLRVARLEDAGDLVLVSSVDEVGMVHAFEGLVGSHGGLGGAQNEAVLVRPAALAVPVTEREDVDGEPMLVGAESVHRRLVAWLVDLGLRPGPVGPGAPGDPGTTASTTPAAVAVEPDEERVERVRGADGRAST